MTCSNSAGTNVLLIAVDSLRADALGVFGNPICRTPHLDRLAAAGTAFGNCFVQYPVCVPSRTSLMTGRYTHVVGHRSQYHFIRPVEENLFRYFKRAGYAVTAIGKNDCLDPSCFPDSVDAWFKSSRPILDGLHGPFSDDPALRHAFLSGRLTPEQGRDGNWEIKERTVAFLREKRPAPWFLYTGFYMPHPKYGVHEPWYSMYDPAAMPDPIACHYDDKAGIMKILHELSGLAGMDPAMVKTLRAIYYGMVSLTDHYVGEIVAALEAAGEFENTTIVFVSDHGDYTGDYGLVEKLGVGFQDCLTRTPLFIKPAAALGLPKGQQAAALCELVDVLPTLLSLYGIPPNDIHYGQSLIPLLRDGNAPHKDAVFCEGGYGPQDQFCFDYSVMKESKFMQSDSPYVPKLTAMAAHPELNARCVGIRTARWKFILRSGEPDELYNLANDPQETVNVAAVPGHEAVIRELKDRLLKFYLETADAPSWKLDRRTC